MRTRPRQTWPPGGWPARAAAAGCGRGHGPPHAWCASWTARRPGCGRAGHAARRAGVPQVLLPGWCLPRRADAAEVIGAALLAHATGAGHRAIAAKLRRPQATVRRWLHAAGAQHTQWLRTRGIQAAARLERETLVGMVWRPQPTALAHALSALGAAALAYHRWLYPRAPAWTLITIITGGRLLAPSG